MNICDAVNLLSCQRQLETCRICWNLATVWDLSHLWSSNDSLMSIASSEGCMCECCESSVMVATICGLSLLRGVYVSVMLISWNLCERRTLWVWGVLELASSSHLCYPICGMLLWCKCRGVYLLPPLLVCLRVVIVRMVTEVGSSSHLCYPICGIVGVLGKVRKKSKEKNKN